jgi:hypothetical protein
MPNEMAAALKERTMRFALRVMRLCRTLPETWKRASLPINCSARARGLAPITARAVAHGSRKDFVTK